MALSNGKKREIAELLKVKIRNKLQNYSPETQQMPFHFRLLGKDRMALYSFVHSVNTMLGQSVFEKVAQIIAIDRFGEAKEHHYVEGYLSDNAVLEIDNIMQELKGAKAALSFAEQDRRIKNAASKGKPGKKRKITADLYLKNGNTEYYFEIKTVKPNIDVFVATKVKLLQWKALRYSIKSNVNVKSYICIPYNPEAPKSYARWTLQGLYDLKNEVLVAEEFWDFLGGKGTYEELLNVFEKTGIELRDEIDRKFKAF
jgi:hypothetical protein